MVSLLYINGALRIAVIVFAGILILVSAITVGIIDNNKDLDDIRDQRNVGSHLKQAKKLIHLSLATAIWLIVLNITVILWEVVYAIFPVVSPRFSFLQRFSVVLMIMDGVFSCVAVTCFVASAIASAVYAAAWSEPPEVCDQNGLYYMYNDCDYEHLERINGIVAFLCFMQAALLSVLGVVAIVGGYPKILVFLPCCLTIT